MLLSQAVKSVSYKTNSLSITHDLARKLPEMPSYVHHSDQVDAKPSEQKNRKTRISNQIIWP